MDYRAQLYSSTDRRLRKAFVELGTLKDKMYLPNSVVEKPAYMYRKAQQRGRVRGRTMSGVLAAIYIACREIGAGKTLKEIAEGSNVESKILSQSYHILLTELNIKIPMLDPMKCIAKVANKMKLNEEYKISNGYYPSSHKERSDGERPYGISCRCFVYVIF